MNNDVLQIKFKNRLNKQASLDYDNIECWQIAEAFNKAQIEWVRRQVHGNNLRKEGDESTKMLIDDLQKILTEKSLSVTDSGKGYFETVGIPKDYLFFKRVSADASTECCEDKNMTVYLTEMADVDNLLSDANRKPSYEWGETFCTMSSNKIRIYTDNAFSISKLMLNYYRKPVQVSFTGCINMETGAASPNVECEFKDDIVEIILDEAAVILAGDIEAMNQMSRLKNNAQTNV
jgi:hypothetical protein